MLFEKRVADAEFNVKAPLCCSCLNQTEHEFDNNHPERPTMTCKVLDTIPKEIAWAESYQCQYFNLDKEKYSINKDIMPEIL